MENQKFSDSNIIRGDAEKYLRYAGIIDWITDAMTNCHFIEAITLEESLISDRLVTACNLLGINKPDDLSFFDKLKKLEDKDGQFDLNYSLAHTWRKERNDFIHNMASTPLSKSTLEDRFKKSQKIAEEGMSLFRDIDSLVKKLKRIKKD